VVGLATFLAAPAIAGFYGDARVGYVLAASAPIALLSAMSAQHVALLNRRMQFVSLAVMDVVGALAGLVVGIACALAWKSYWALYAATLATAVAMAFFAVVLTRWMPGPPRRDPDLKSLVSFGAGMTGFNIANFLARNADNVLIGRVWGGAALGLYDRAYKLVLFPLQQINAPLSRIMVPILSRLIDEPQRYRDAYLRVNSQILLISAPGVIFMAVAADWLIKTVLGEQWLGVTQIFRCLAAAGLIQVFNNPMGWLFISQGRTGQFAKLGAITAVTCILAFSIGIPWGPLGVAIAYASSEVLIRTPIIWRYAGSRGPVRLSDLVMLAIPFGVAAVASTAAVIGARAAIGANTVYDAILLLFVAYATFWCVLSLQPRGRQALLDALLLVKGLGQRVGLWPLAVPPPPAS
jgi:PST family polysaccharide transporter